tara:strand:+ start:1586 stop:1870 length:285 start_codon:yes stop_codon:yes gene_type:complete
MTINTELVWKILTLLISVAVVPLFGWVWTMNTEVSKLGIQFAHHDEKLEEMEVDTSKSMEIMERNSQDIALIQRDIEHISENIGEIKELVQKEN